MSENEFTGVTVQEHTHGPKKLKKKKKKKKKKKLGEDTSTGPGLPITREVAPQYIDES